MTPSPAPTAHPLLLAAALLAWVGPTLLAYSLPPSPTLLNQCAALVGGGVWVLALGPRRSVPRAMPLLGALLLVLLAVAASVPWRALPASLGLGMGGQVVAALLLVWAGADAARRADAPAVARAWFVGLLAAGVAGAAVGLLQVFWPGLTDPYWLAESTRPGLAVGNLRQPNHLSTLLLWAVVATVVLHGQGRLNRAVLWGLVALFVTGIELTASRTGAVGLLLLAAWGALDRGLPRGARAVLLATPVLYGLAWAGVAAWAHWQGITLGAEARAVAEAAAAGTSPNARLNVFRTAWQLVMDQPWTGVGIGQFNLAWTLTPLPGRPTAFFDHAHNLPLHLLAELGVPLGLLVLGLLAWAAWRAVAGAARAEGDAGMAARGAAAMVVLVLVHSLVEYPLWYAYFLLPAAFAWGFAMAAPSAAGRSGAAARSMAAPRSRLVGSLAGVLMVAGGLFAVSDYQRVARIYQPAADDQPLYERIAEGQFHSVLFAHMADYASATNGMPLASQALALLRAPHVLLDTRLMMAWADFLARTGEVDKARWLAARLREFNNPASARFFAVCEADAPQRDAGGRGASAAPGTGRAGGRPVQADPMAAIVQPAARGFQCEAPERTYTWLDFVAPVDWERLERQARERREGATGAQGGQDGQSGQAVGSGSAAPASR